MSSEMRDEFERWFLESRKSKGASHRPTFERMEDGTYADNHTQRHWWTWQNAQAARIDELEAEVAEQARLNGMGAERELALIGQRDQLRAERNTLARWKSTNAPRIEALRGLKDKAQADAAKGAEAVLSLASERKANDILTSEVEALRAEVKMLQGAITEFCQSHSWAAGSWKAEPYIKPLFDITRAIKAAKEAK
jgi:hypothetical protein